METDLICTECGDKFTRQTREITRAQKKGKANFFCGLKCSAIFGNRTTPRIRPAGRGSKLSPTGLPVGGDEFTPFRWFVLRAKYRQLDTDITAGWLKSLWEIQQGLCPLTGWKLILPINTNGWASQAPSNASLDRINNNVGYLQNNVRFVALIANLARSTFSDEEVRKFGEATNMNYPVIFEIRMNNKILFSDPIVIKRLSDKRVYLDSEAMRTLMDNCGSGYGDAQFSLTLNGSTLENGTIDFQNSNECMIAFH